MKPFQPWAILLGLGHALWRWRPRRVEEVPVERPPGCRTPRGRLHVVWGGSQLQPYVLEIREPERDPFWMR